MKRLALTCLMIMATPLYAATKNPWLADSPWPMSHHDSYATDSSSVTGPVSDVQLGTPSFITTDLANITLAASPKYMDGRYAYWGSSSHSVYKLLPVNGELRKIDQLQKPGQSSFIKTPTSGAYTLVDVNNVFYTAQGTHLLSYVDQARNMSVSKITLLKDLPLENYGVDADDAIVGLNMTWDGHIAFATKKGVVGVVNRTLDSSPYLVHLASNEAVSNSISTDELGGIFVVTSQKMHRVQWTGSKLSLAASDGAWEASYNTGSDGSGGGHLGAGSGSTPTVMGEAGQQQFVVITDGAKVANIVLFWKDAIPADWKPIATGKDPRIAAEVPVNFGDPNREATFSEQSVVVSGYGAVVVSNDYQHVDKIAVSTPYEAINQFLNGVIALASGMPQHQPWGVQKFQWDPQARKLNSAWVNMDVSCPNAIPTVSASAKTFYCVGARYGQWTIEGLNWDNGQSRFRKYLGFSPSFNSFYAATEVAADGGIIYGSVDGVVYIPRR